MRPAATVRVLHLERISQLRTRFLPLSLLMKGTFERAPPSGVTMLRSCLAVSWIGVATVATAGPVRMTDDAIKQQLTSSAVLEIDTPLGLTIPVRFSSNG